MIKVLVTGGAGFIGSHLTDELIKKGYEVIVLDDLSGGFLENINNKAKFTKGSITDNELVSNLFKRHNFDYVFHLAAYAAEGLSHFIKRFNYQNNLIGSINLINQAILNEVKCFVYTSSIAVYGSNQPPMVEKMDPNPEDSYGIAKYAVETELKISKEIFDLDYIIFRPHNVFGERQNIGDKYRNVIGIFMNQIMKSQPMTIFGDGKQTRAFSYISNIVPVIAESVEKQEAFNEIFNIGSDEDYSVIELAHEVAKVMGVKPEVKKLQARNEVKHAYCNHDKIKDYFNVSGSVPLSDGLSKMAIWAKGVGVRKSKKFSNIEITKNLPDGWISDVE